MFKDTTSQIKMILDKESVFKDTKAEFEKFFSTNDKVLRDEGNPHHICVFFLPFDKEKNMIYLGHHKKADDWISPGGHIDKGETPIDTVIREYKEELRVDISKEQVEPFDLSVKKITRKGFCKTHYDIWHLVHTDTNEYDFDEKEYHDAGWFGISEGASMVKKNPDFREIISKLARGNNE